MLSDEERQRLDMLYGPARPAGGNGVQSHELTRHPRSRQKLDSTSAGQRREHLQSVAGKFEENGLSFWLDFQTPRQWQASDG